jgi:hypothetical protein
MISTKAIIYDLNQVPTEWPFEFYLNLPEKLTGQDVKIKSVFSAEKTPSFCIYSDKMGKYRFKDFSTGKSGDTIDFVLHYYNLESRGIAVRKIMDDYSDYVSRNDITPREYKPESRYEVSDYEIRHWNNLDQDFWLSYKIGSKVLDKHNVQPLKYFILSKSDQDGAIKELRFENNYTYGYFKNDGTLYKIYQPKNKVSKFIKVSDYIQGSEQITFESKYLIITKSLKDIMSFKTLGIGNVETIAPDSENSMIAENIMKKYIQKYAKIILIFDNDEPGIEAAKTYKKRYGFDYIVLPCEKDISDTVKARGLEETRNIVFKSIKALL